MAKLKYIIDKRGNVRVFPELVGHDDYAADNGMLNRVAAAGFCGLVTIEHNPRGYEVSEDTKENDDRFGVRWKCWGESTSLGIKCRGKEDEIAIDRAYRDVVY